MMKRFTVVLILLFPLWLSAQENEEESEEVLDTPILFDEDQDQAVSEDQARGAQSVLNSGNKVGYRAIFNYSVSDNPFLMTSYFLDIPFSDNFAVSIDIGGQEQSITSHTFTTNGGGTTNFSSVEVGQKEYVSFTGILKYYYNAFYTGLGLSYNKFLKGYIVPTTTTSTLGLTQYEYYSITEDNDEYYALISAGYLAELRPNVFLNPEFSINYRLFPSDTRIVIGFSLGLGLKL